MTCHRRTDARKNELARIHILAGQLGLIADHDDSAYRDMLWTHARVRTAAKLDAAGRKKVLDHLYALRRQGSVQGKRPHHAGTPHNIDSADRGPLLRKIEAYLAEAKRPWSYTDSMAKRMFNVDQLAFCSPEQLRKIIAALDYDARRHGRYRGPRA